MFDVVLCMSVLGGVLGLLSHRAPAFTHGTEVDRLMFGPFTNGAMIESLFALLLHVVERSEVTEGREGESRIRVPLVRKIKSQNRQGNTAECIPTVMMGWEEAVVDRLEGLRVVIPRSARMRKHLCEAQRTFRMLHTN